MILTVLIVGAGLAPVAAVCGLNRLIDATRQRPVTAVPQLAVRAGVNPCPNCGGPLAVTHPDADDRHDLIGRAHCSACDLRLEVTAA